MPLIVAKVTQLIVIYAASIIVFRTFCGHELLPPVSNRMFYGRGCAMAKQREQLTFTFVNPNTAKELERHLQMIIIDKLLSQYRSSAVID